MLLELRGLALGNPAVPRCFLNVSNKTHSLWIRQENVHFPLCAHVHRKLPQAQKRRKTMRILNHRLLLGEENPYLRILQGEGWTGDNNMKLKFILENYFFLRETRLLILLGDLKPFVLRVLECSESSVEPQARHRKWLDGRKTFIN